MARFELHCIDSFSPLFQVRHVILLGAAAKVLSLWKALSTRQMALSCWWEYLGWVSISLGRSGKFSTSDQQPTGSGTRHCRITGCINKICTNSNKTGTNCPPTHDRWWATNLPTKKHCMTINLGESCRCQVRPGKENRGGGY